MRRGPWCRRTPSGTATWWSRSRSSRRCASTARPGGASSTRRGASAAPRSPPTAQASAESTFGVDAEACKRARVEVPGDHDVLGLLERSQRAARGFTQDAVRRARLVAARIERLLHLADRRRSVLLLGAAGRGVGFLEAERGQRRPVELPGGLQLLRALEVHQRGLRLRAHAAVDAAGPEAAIVERF